MDIGFRLGAHADRHRIPVSADLAVILVDALTGETPALGHREPNPLHYGGRVALLGVPGGSPYPLTWWACRDTDVWDAERVLLGYSADLEDLGRFCREYLRATTGFERPFVAGDPDTRYGYVPLSKRRARVELIQRMDMEQAPAEGPPPPEASIPSSDEALAVEEPGPPRPDDDRSQP
jgi:hypothetical protein